MARWARAAVERPPPNEQDAPAPGAQADPPGAHADRQLIAERRLRGAELALGGARRELERARQQLTRLSQRAAELEAELRRARVEPQRLRELLRVSERLRRQAEQFADAEHRERERLERLLASARRPPGGERDDGSDARAAALAQRAAELERRLRERERELDELEHLLAVARRARDRAEARAAALQAAGPMERRAPELGGTRGVRGPAEERGVNGHGEAREGIGGSSGGQAGEIGTLLAAVGEELDALAQLARREHEQRRRAQARIAELELELEIARRAGSRALSVTETLAQELRELGAGAPDPAQQLGELGAGAPDAPARAPAANGAESVQGAFPTQPASLPDDPAGRVEPELLNAALSRLRNGRCAEGEQRADDAAKPDPVTHGGGSRVTATGPWLRRALRRLARRDPTAAGEVVLALLALARAPDERPIAFDIVLGADECVQVDASDHRAEVRVEAGPRPLEQVAARISTDLAGLGRLVGAGALARLLGRARVDLQGSRRALRTLRALADQRVRLSELGQLGVQMPAELLLKLVAAMLTPSITGGVSLTIAHRCPGGGGGGAFLSVTGRQRPQAGELPPGVMSSLTVWCEEQALAALLDGELEPERCGARVEGAIENLRRLRDWIQRAQLSS
jgi:hypothetical protein